MEDQSINTPNGLQEPTYWGEEVSGTAPSRPPPPPPRTNRAPLVTHEIAAAANSMAVSRAAAQEEVAMVQQQDPLAAAFGQVKEPQIATAEESEYNVGSHKGSVTMFKQGFRQGIKNKSIGAPSHGFALPGMHDVMEDPNELFAKAKTTNGSSNNDFSGTFQAFPEAQTSASPQKPPPPPPRRMSSISQSSPQPPPPARRGTSGLQDTPSSVNTYFPPSPADSTFTMQQQTPLQSKSSLAAAFPSASPQPSASGSTGFPPRKSEGRSSFSPSPPPQSMMNRGGFPPSAPSPVGSTASSSVQRATGGRNSIGSTTSKPKVSVNFKQDTEITGLVDFDNMISHKFEHYDESTKPPVRSLNDLASAKSKVQQAQARAPAFAPPPPEPVMQQFVPQPAPVPQQPYYPGYSSPGAYPQPYAAPYAGYPQIVYQPPAVQPGPVGQPHMMMVPPHVGAAGTYPGYIPQYSQQPQQPPSS